MEHHGIGGAITEVPYPTNTTEKKLRARTLRLIQGPSSVSKRKATSKTYMTRILANETAEQKELRLEKDREKYAQRMFLESDSKRAARNAKLVKRYQKKKKTTDHSSAVM
jgi:hypothetical protein